MPIFSKRAVLTVALGGISALSVAAVAVGATATLHGPWVLHPVTDPPTRANSVTYRATHLRAHSGYALRLVRPTTDHSPRCVAYLSGPRQASGTEYFYGSVPGGMVCTTAPHTPRAIKDGYYTVEVCVPRTQLGACRGAQTIIRRRVHVIN